MRYGSIGGLEYEVPQSRLYCLCINVALCSTALQCICRVIRRSSMIMKAHTYYIIFGRPPIRGEASPLPLWRRHCVVRASVSRRQPELARVHGQGCLIAAARSCRHAVYALHHHRCYLVHVLKSNHAHKLSTFCNHFVDMHKLANLYTLGLVWCV